MFAEADRLTLRLAEIEQELAAQPWKIEAECAASSSSSDILSFERTDRGWKFVWQTADPQNGTRRFLVKDASIEVKTLVASLVPHLVERMKSRHAALADKLRQGHQALDKVEQALRKPISYADLLHRELSKDAREGA